MTQNRRGIIKWDVFDQIINKIDHNILYTKMIYFSTANDKCDEIAFLKNQVRLYEFSIESKTADVLSLSAIATATSTHRFN
jgi:hypothetical protein